MERIENVAAVLSERPAGFGRPISDRVAWEQLAERESFRGMIEEAEQVCSDPVPEQADDLYLDFSRTGNRTRWQQVARRRRDLVKTLVLAECLDNRGRFVPKFEELARALCAERAWVMPAHDKDLANFEGRRIDIDLASSALAWNLATAGYLLGSRLSPEVRQLLRDNVRRRVLVPFEDMVSGARPANHWLTNTNNWNAVCLAGVTGAALTQVESRRQRAAFIVAAEAYSQNFLKGFGPDGCCTEGVGYWNYGFGHYVLLAEAVCQATGG
ncbi:MAG: heparinase II/III domain-containing protein, partial [Planctomycetota bacterium]